MTHFRELKDRLTKAGTGHRGKKRGRGLGLWWTFAAGLVVLGAVIIAIAGNGQHVRVHYLEWHVDVSLIVVILTTALIAVLLDEVGGLIWRRRRRARLGRRNELAELRSSQGDAGATPLVTEDSPPLAEVNGRSMHPAAPEI